MEFMLLNEAAIDEKLEVIAITKSERKVGYKLSKW